MSLRLTSLKVEMDPDSQERISDASPRFAKQPTVLTQTLKMLSLVHMMLMQQRQSLQGHFMSRLVKRNKRKGKGE